MTTTKAPEALLKRLRDDNRFLLTSHANPDGDAIGSEIGLRPHPAQPGQGSGDLEPRPVADAAARAARGHPDPQRRGAALGVPRRLSTRSSSWSARAWIAPGSRSTSARCRCSTSTTTWATSTTRAVNWVDPAAPAVGEMVFRLAQGLMVELDAQTATALFLTLVSDTGGFRFANATAEAFEAGAALVREGARPEQVAEWLYESRPMGSIRLLGEMLQSLELHADGRDRHGPAEPRDVRAQRRRDQRHRGPGRRAAVDRRRSRRGPDAPDRRRRVQDLAAQHAATSTSRRSPARTAAAVTRTPPGLSPRARSTRCASARRRADGGAGLSRCATGFCWSTSTRTAPRTTSCSGCGGCCGSARSATAARSTREPPAC